MEVFLVAFAIIVQVGHVKNVRISLFWTRIYRLTLNQRISCQLLVF